MSALASSLRQAFTRQRHAAKCRGIAWELSFEDWRNVWLSSGRLQERGRGAHKYVMARKGDVGPYSLQNVQIITGAQNCSDAAKNKPWEGRVIRAPNTRLGKGKGWTFKGGAYQVVVCHKYIGRFGSPAEAEAAYMAACQRLGVRHA